MLNPWLMRCVYRRLCMVNGKACDIFVELTKEGMLSVIYHKDHYTPELYYTELQRYIDRQR